jgi:hypothetical protein
MDRPPSGKTTHVRRDATGAKSRRHRRREYSDPPDRLHELLFREQATGIRGQHDEQVERLGVSRTEWPSFNRRRSLGMSVTVPNWIRDAAPLPSMEQRWVGPLMTRKTVGAG